LPKVALNTKNKINLLCILFRNWQWKSNMAITTGYRLTLVFFFMYCLWWQSNHWISKPIKNLNLNFRSNVKN
jgi:hypothetical protein